MRRLLLPVLALALAAAACAGSQEQVAEAVVVAIPPEQAAIPEFHGARLGADTLRGHLPGE